MPSFYLAAWLVFSLLKAASLCLHFLGDTPYGVPVVEAPGRFLPNAIVFETGLLLVFALLFLGMERLSRRLLQTGRNAAGLRGGPVFSGFWKAAYLLFNFLWLWFGQFDQEVIRWLGNHVTLSYLRTYLFSGQDEDLLARLFGADLPYFIAGLAVGVLLPAALAIALWRRRRAFPEPRFPGVLIAILTAAIFTGFPFWWNFSEKRWRRIRPAGVEIVADLVRGLRGLDNPRDAGRATADLASFVAVGRLSDTTAPAPVAEYPLWRTSPGRWTPEEFRALPLAGKPNIVLVMFETLRGWRSGLTGDGTDPAPYPPLADFLRREAAYFPWAHSHGFPSVEGCAAIHLGLWSHYSNVLISDYIHIRSRSLPEILRGSGYHAEMVFGYDPSFGNFTPWMHRWYDRLEYNPANNVDGPLLKRVAGLTDTLSAGKPWMVTFWTTVTHPPFNVPAAEGVKPAAEVDERYDQSLAYAGREMLNFFETLRRRPDWNRTIVIMVGDHGTPDSWQIRNPDRVGDLSPGHTWTSLAVFGGWPGLPARGLNRATVSQSDIGPTVLGLLDLKVGHHFMGRDLFAPASGSAGLPDSAPGPERGFMTARFDAVALVQGEDRLYFRMDGRGEGVHYRVSKRRDADYGLLDETSPQPGAPDPALFPPGSTARYRDMLRQYGALLDGDRLMPPGLKDLPGLPEPGGGAGKVGHGTR
jgi:lipoteichoic acid synthase